MGGKDVDEAEILSIAISCEVFREQPLPKTVELKMHKVLPRKRYTTRRNLQPFKLSHIIYFGLRCHFAFSSEARDPNRNIRSWT